MCSSFARQFLSVALPVVWYFYIRTLFPIDEEKRKMSTGSRWAHVGVHNNRCVKSQVVWRKSSGIEFDANDFKWCVDFSNWRLFIIIVLGGGSSYASSACNWPKANYVLFRDFDGLFHHIAQYALTASCTFNQTPNILDFQPITPLPLNGVKFLFGNCSRLRVIWTQLSTIFLRWNYAVRLGVNTNAVILAYSTLIYERENYTIFIYL